MPVIPLNLSLAERQGLTLYSRSLRHFSSQERDKVSSVRDLRRSLPDDRIVATIPGRNPFIVHLERISADNWEGDCTCDLTRNCVHCAAVADAALGTRTTALQANPSTQTKSRPTPSSGLLQQVADLLGRGLITTEVTYLQRLENFYVRAQSTRTATLLDVIGLTEGSNGIAGNPAYFNLDAWPSFPADPIEFWHAIARQARHRNFTLPAFMERVAQLAPPPKAWLKAWEKKDIEGWLKRLEESDRNLENPFGNAPEQPTLTETLDVRLVLATKSPRVEIWTTSQPAWRPAKKSVLGNLASDYFLGRLDVLPECVQLWEPIARSAGSPYDFELSYQDGFPFQRLICQVLQKPALHSRILGEDLQPLQFPQEPLHWKVSPPTPEQPQYHVELVLPDGRPLQEVRIRLKGPPAFAITGDAVHRLPPIPSAFAPDRPTLIPAKAVETEAGIRLLTRMGASLPENLATLAEKVPLHLHLEFGVVAPDNAYKPVERIVISASARTAENEIVDSYLGGLWVQPKSRKTKSQRITLYERDRVWSPTDALDALGARWDENVGAFSLRITRNFPETFASWARTLHPSIELALPALLQSILHDPVVATVALNATPTDVDWFDLSVEITSQNTDLTPEELNLLLNARGGYVRLGDKGWRRAQINLSPEDTEQLAHIGLNPLDLSSEPQRFHALQLADDVTRKLLPEAQADAIQRRASEIKARVTPAVPTEIQASLRPYQIDGFHFLAYLAENRFGGVLADDMGLGKTLQTLTWIAWLRASLASSNPAPDQPSRILIVCPKSVAPNWRAEATRFLPGIRVTVWQGQSTADFTSILAESDALVLNFAQLRSLQDQLAAQHWLAVIIDEAQAIKNPDSQTAQSARSLKASHRLALTGTPIENRLMDLWSILSFAMPGALGSRADFQRTFGKASDSLARRRLSARVRPFLLRRTKSQVAQDLPPRIEEDLICELDGVQRDLYRAEYKKARTLLLKVKSSADLDQLRFHFLTSLLRLRQICCHPALVDKRQINKPSAKVEALLDVLEPLMEEGNKVLIFSQFVSMLDLLQEELRQRSWKDFYLAGDTEDRGPLVDSFNQHDGAAVFLISLKAGGFGLNLTSASYVVLFDPWWNPAVESQAIDRTHRIGQKNTVIAYRLLIKGSIEEKIRELQKQKSALAGDILGEERFSQALTIDDLQFLFSSAEPTL